MTIFERFRERLQRAMSFEYFQDPAMHNRPQENASSSGTPKISPRKLRRTAATSNLRAICDSSKAEQLERPSPVTPEHQRPISRKEAQKGHGFITGILENGGSLVRLPSGDVLGLNESVSVSSNDDDSPFVRPIPLQRQASSATVIIHRRSFDEQASEGNDLLRKTPQDGISTSRKRGYDESEDPDDDDTEEALRPQKRVCKLSELQPAEPSSSPSPLQKRARSPDSSIDGSDTEEPVRPQKWICKSFTYQAPDRSSSPSPPQSFYHRRTRFLANRAHSTPQIGRVRRESIENNPLYIRGSDIARRVWSTEDVLIALRTGRASTQAHAHDKSTPPHSPIVSTHGLQGNIYKLPLPKTLQPLMHRNPLGDITDKLVPKFLQAPSPMFHVEEDPPSPGRTFHHLLDCFTDNRESPERFPCGHDGAIDPQMIGEGQDDANTKAADAINSELSEDLEHAKEDGKLELPIVAHVLRGLDNDAKFLQDALRQVKLLRERVLKHDERAKEAKAWLDSPQSPTTQDETTQAMANMARFLREAKAYEEAAARADAEASEYRRKAKELLENAMAEVAMYEVDDHYSGN